jgi:hypothetical protein
MVDEGKGGSSRGTVENGRSRRRPPKKRIAPVFFETFFTGALITRKSTHRSHPQESDTVEIRPANRDRSMPKSTKSAFRLLLRDLKRLKSKLKDRDIMTVDHAIEELEGLEFIRDEIEMLKLDFAESDNLHEIEGATEYEKGKIELVASAAAVSKVRSFLSLIAPSHSLQLLENALTGLVQGGAVSAMFAPFEEFTSRPRDAPQIMGMKGALAGMMRTLQDAGTSREAAANLIARNLSPELTARISRKPITARTVKEWADRFGGDHAEENSGRRAYRTWSRGTYASPLNGQKIREMTERMSKTLPARKPS